MKLNPVLCIPFRFYPLSPPEYSHLCVLYSILPPDFPLPNSLLSLILYSTPPNFVGSIFGPFSVWYLTSLTADWSGLSALLPPSAPHLPYLVGSLELWRSCDDLAHGDVPLATDQPTSPIAPAHKRARSVDTGKATQQPGPPAEASQIKKCREPFETSAISRFCRQSWRKKWTMATRMITAHHHPPKLDLSVAPPRRLPSQVTLEMLRASPRRK